LDQLAHDPAKVALVVDGKDRHRSARRRALVPTIIPTSRHHPASSETVPRSSGKLASTLVISCAEGIDT
jgi:hypothetical protein